MVSVQNPYSLVNRTYEIGMSEISIRENAGLLAYSPLAIGYLTESIEIKIFQKILDLTYFIIITRGTIIKELMMQLMNILKLHKNIKFL